MHKYTDYIDPKFHMLTNIDRVKFFVESKQIFVGTKYSFEISESLKYMLGLSDMYNKTTLKNKLTSLCDTIIKLVDNKEIKYKLSIDEYNEIINDVNDLKDRASRLDRTSKVFNIRLKPILVDLLTIYICTLINLIEIDDKIFEAAKERINKERAENQHDEIQAASSPFEGSDEINGESTDESGGESGDEKDI